MRQCGDCGRLHLDVDCEICALKEAHNGLHQDTLTKGNESLRYLRKFSPVGIESKSTKELAYKLFELFEDEEVNNTCEKWGFPVMDFVIQLLVSRNKVAKEHTNHMQNIYELWHYTYGGVIESL